jgi:ATP-dependent helicase/nuclease subunit A
MDNMPIDQTQRDQALDFSKSFIVQAPAGSGKTSLLIQRYLKLLAYAVTEPEECLAITFTRKAAAEMLNRVLRALETAKEESQPTERQALKTWQLARAVLAADQKYFWNILENPNRLRIQTIDALCGSIITRAPIITKFGCNLEVAEDANEFYTEAAINFLTANNDDFDEDINLISYHLDNNQNKIVQLFTAMLANREKWMQNLLALSKAENYMEYFNHGLKMAIQDAMSSAYNSRPDFFHELLELLDVSKINLTGVGVSAKFSSDDILIWQEIVQLVLNKSGEVRKTITKQQGFPAATDCKIRMLALLECLRTEKDFILALQSIQKISFTGYTDDQQIIFAALLKILPVLVAHLHLVFQQKGKIDFTEVTDNAIQALGDLLNPSDLALILDYKIQHIMVDEFQDTSQSQFDLLLALTRGWNGLDGKTIFLVGDPMQSIYRFRNADVGLFLYAKKQGIGDVKLNFLQLTANFRSVSRIVDWINNVFVSSFPVKDDISNGAISFSPSKAYKTSITDSNINLNFKNTSFSTEAENIASYIQQQYKTNPAGTIAILVRSRSHLKQIIKALNVHNIVFTGVEIDPLISKPIVQDLLNLTNSMLHLGDNIAWYAVLRTKWLGLALKDLQSLYFNKQTLLWDNILNFDTNHKLSLDAKSRLQKFVWIMQKSINKIGIVNLSKLVYATWQELDGLKILQSQAELQDSEQFFRLLEQEENNVNIYNVDYLKNKVAKVYSKIDSAAVNPVQIMTIHKSKGLEFDTVIVPGLAQPLRSDEEKLLLWQENLSSHGSTYLLAAPIKSFLETEDSIYNYVKSLDKKKSRYEDLRLLYVALTRAKINLYLSAAIEKDLPAANSLLRLVWENIPVKIEANGIEKNSIKINAQSLNVSVSNYLHRIKTDCLYANKLVFIKDSDMILASCNESVGSKDNIVELDPNREWMRHVGTLVHRELWRISTQGISSWNEEIVGIVKKRWFISLNKLGVTTNKLLDAVDLVAVAITNTLSCPHGRWILDQNHLQAKSEWPLTTYVNDQIANVVIDRSFVDENGNRWVIDYKTCYTENTDLELELYKIQLHKYFGIVRKFCNESNIRTGLYFPLQKRWEVIN